MISDKKALIELCTEAVEAAQLAGSYIQSQIGEFHKKSKKVAGSSLASQVVTRVDEKAQCIILDHLEKSIKKYDLGLLTEEQTDDQSRFLKSYFWCIDPLDGTLPFTEGKTGYAVSISLVSKKGDPVIGVVYIPDKDDCYMSIKGDGVMLNGESFYRDKLTFDRSLNVYLDKSLAREDYFDLMTSKLEGWCEKSGFENVSYNLNYGAVCNAIGVMNSSNGCYFKFPKKQEGGGSIWDFSSTRLFFEELGLPVADMKGNPLHLNSAKTTFMNGLGINYASDLILSSFIQELHIRLIGLFKAL